MRFLNRSWKVRQIKVKAKGYEAKSGKDLEGFIFKKLREK